MGLWKRLLGRKTAIDVTNPQHALMFFGSDTKAGAKVNFDTALQVSVVLGCLRVISEDVAKLPLKLFRQQDNNRREPISSGPLYDVLTRSVQPWTSAFDFRRAMTARAALEGNAYAFIIRDGRGAVRELQQIPPGRTRIEFADGTLEPSYVVTMDGSAERRFAWDEIFHLRGFSVSPLAGLPVYQWAREAIGLAIVAEESQARLHANGARPSGILSVEGTLGKEAATNLAKQFADAYAGSMQTGKVPILDRKAKFDPMTMTGVDAQHLETRKHQIEEICRAFRVQPIMVMQSDKAATFASAEAMFAAHRETTIAPWCETWEAELELKLAPTRDVRIRHDLVMLMRPNAKDRSEFYAKMVTNGLMTGNEIRAIEDLPPLPGLDEPIQPLNMAPAGNDQGGEEADNVVPISASARLARRVTQKRGIYAAS